MKQKKKLPAVRDIPVVILCGGRGTRLKEETEFIPKPMVRIGDKPILWHIMKIYYAQGFRKFILLLGYKGEHIRDWVQNYELYANDFTVKHATKSTRVYHGRAAEDWEITCLDTGLETQTGARIRRARAHIKSPVFMLTYGDGVADVDVHKVLAEHARQKCLVTMTAVHPPVRFGEVHIKDGRVTGFHEKPDRLDSHTSGSLINGGFFAVSADIFSKMPANDDLVFERDVLTKLAKAGELAAIPHPGYWQCMDTIRDTEMLNDAWKSGKASWKVW